MEGREWEACVIELPVAIPTPGLRLGRGAGAELDILCPAFTQSHCRTGPELVLVTSVFCEVLFREFGQWEKLYGIPCFRISSRIWGIA